MRFSLVVLSVALASLSAAAQSPSPSPQPVPGREAAPAAQHVTFENDTAIQGKLAHPTGGFLSPRARRVEFQRLLKTRARFDDALQRSADSI